MKRRNIRLILLIALLPILSYGQLDELKDELFVRQKFVTFVIDSADVRCPVKTMNISLFKESIKMLVDEDAVLMILRKITFQPSEINKDSLQDIYSKFAYEYYQNWGEVYLNLCLPNYKRVEAEKQFKILKGFENALKSISFRHSNAEEIWDAIIEEYQLFNVLMYHHSERNDAIDRTKTYSEEYKKLNKKAWYASSCEFTYLEPYISKVKDFFINKLNQCKCPFKIDECDLSFIKQYIYYIPLINDDRAAQIFIENKDCINLDPNYFWFPVRYLEKRHNPELLRITLRKLFESESTGHIDYKIAHIFRNEDNREIFQKELSTAIELLQITAIENSVIYANRQTLKSLKRAKKNSLKGSATRILIEKQIKIVKFKMNHVS